MDLNVVVIVTNNNQVSSNFQLLILVLNILFGMFYSRLKGSGDEGWIYVNPLETGNLPETFIWIKYVLVVWHLHN